MRRERIGGERGQLLILTAFGLVTVLALSAFTINASFMYDKRNRLYAAADAGAKSGALEVHRNSGISSTDLQTFVYREITNHGFNPGGTTSVTINRPPATGPFSSDNSYVEVIVSESTSSFFDGFLALTSLTPGARAVAGPGNPNNCLITTAPPGSSPTSLGIGNTQLTLNGCSVGDAGDLDGNNPNATINGTPTPAVAVTGSCNGTCGAMGTLTLGTPPPIDPFAGPPPLAAPPAPDPATCIPGVGPVLLPGCYTSIANSVTTLTGGGQNSIYYIISGTVNISNLTGNNVMIYLTGTARLHSANNNILTLVAMTSGTYSGIAIFQDPSDNQNFDTGNSFTLSVKGAIYMPGADVDFPNSLNFVNTGCTLFVAHSLNVRNGNGIMSNNNCGDFSGAAFLSISMAE